MKYLISRNVKLFFRDKASVFFSFLAVIIILGLYILFLGNTMDFGLENKADSRRLGDAWIMSGIVAVTGVTTTMGAFGTMVSDRKTGVYKDFYCAPVKHSTVALSYVISTIIVGMLTSLFTLLIAEIFIVANGGAALTFPALINVVGLILLSVFSGCSMVFLLVSFFKSENAFAAASSIIGTLVGFIAGLYIPIGALPSYVQVIVKLFPVSHSAMLLRRVFVMPLLDQFMANAPAEALAGLKEFIGVSFYAGGNELPALISYLILLGATVLFFTLALLNLSRKQK